MELTMYAYDPTGHAHLIPGMDIPTMNVLLDLNRDTSDTVINVHDVTDLDGSSRRVIVILYRGLVFHVFTWVRKRP